MMLATQASRLFQGAQAAHAAAASGVRGLAWKTNSRPTREQVMGGLRRGWNASRQKVPPRVRILEASWKFAVGDHVEFANRANEKLYRQRGKIIEIRPDENRVVVDGINPQKKLVRRTEEGEGGAKTIWGPVHYSNIALIDPTTNQAMRSELKTRGNKKVRVLKPSGYVLPFPKGQPLIRPSEGDSPFDTAAQHVHEITYKGYDEYMRNAKFS